MPLSREQVYNDLDGAEAKEILLQRFALLLDTCPLLRKSVTLPRAILTTSIKLELWGCSPPEITLPDEIAISTSPTKSLSGIQLEEAGYPQQTYSSTDIVDARHNPPDQIRDEHSLPIASPTKSRTTGFTQDIAAPVAAAPAVAIPDPPAFKPVKRDGHTYARWVELDRQGPVSSGNIDYQTEVAIDIVNTGNQGLRDASIADLEVPIIDGAGNVTGTSKLNLDRRIRFEER